MNNKDFLLAEYQALSEYFMRAIDFRFIVFGFYITTLGLILADKVKPYKLIIIIILTILIWLLELRNRGLAGSMIERGIEIENSIYGEEASIEENTFFYRIKYGGPGKNPTQMEIRKGETTRIFGIKIKSGLLFHNKDYRFYIISHSFIFDFAYLGAILAAASYLIILLTHCD